MQFDKRKGSIMFGVKDGSKLPKDRIPKEGDEVYLYHDGNLVTAEISSIKGKQMVGTITRSPYNPDLHPELSIGKELQFVEENIFVISK